jgi:NTE family protein
MFNLILSGGGALGFAHMPLIDYLDKNNMRPENISGTSMGAILGAIMALELSDKKRQERISHIVDFLKWFRISFTGKSLVDSKKIKKLLKDTFGDITFKDLNHNLYITATNFHTGEKIVFSKENDVLLRKAILASMSIPSIFPPVKIKNEYYVDGYLSENLPILDNGLHSIISNVTGQKSFKEYYHKDSLKDISALAALERSSRIIIYNQTKESLSKLDSYILLEPDVSMFKTSDFSKYKEIYTVGTKEIEKIFK